MTGYTHRMPGICAASGATGTIEDADAWHAARAARERADRLEWWIDRIETAMHGASYERYDRLERMLTRVKAEHQEADTAAKAGGE